MAYLNVLATIKMPVRAVGSMILDSDDNTLAKVENSFMAEAMATLMNYGVEKAKQVNRAHAVAEEAKGAMLFGKRKSPWSMS